jgi:hypothetical protein
MSVVLWSGGQTWVTNSGYWPYDLWSKEHAAGWDGANAPHLLGEPAQSLRETELLGFADDVQVTVLDLRRRGPAGYAARRQLIQLGSELLLVLDHIQDRTAGRSITVWTVDPALAVTQIGSEYAYRLASRGSGLTMSIFFLASSGTEIKTFRGSRQPFAGWVMNGSTPMPATAFRLDQASDGSWALALWVPEKRGGASAVAAPPQMLDWTSGERWKLSIPWRGGNAIIQRMDSEILVQQGTGAQDLVRLKLVGGPSVRAERAVIKSAFEANESQFGKRYRDLHRYRLKVSYLLLALLALQESILFLLRNAMRKYWFALRTVLASAWLIMGAWVVVVYLEAGR